MTTMMKSEPTPPDREVLTGLVERVTCQNAENGFCVVRVKSPGSSARTSIGRTSRQGQPTRLRLARWMAAGYGRPNRKPVAD